MAPRVDPFAEAPTDDLTFAVEEFTPKPVRKSVDRDQLEALGRATGYDRPIAAPRPSAAVEEGALPTPIGAPGEAAQAAPSRQHRYRTGRDVQLNIKCSPATKQRFAVLAQSRNISNAELFERLLDGFEQRKR
jgi:hypothetical protein